MIPIINVETKITYSTQETREARWDICKECENYSVDENVEIGKEYCLACDCILATKIANQDSTCPAGKW